MAGIRARIRTNRTHTQSRRHPPLRQVQDPSCTYPACRQSAPFYLDTIEHILLFCPRHDVARQQLQNATLATTPSPSSCMTLAFLLRRGVRANRSSITTAQTRSHLTELTAAFLTQVSTDRKTDPASELFTSTTKKEIAPD